MGIPQKSGDFWAYIIFHRITQEMLTTDIFHLQELITVILNFLKILNFYLQIFQKTFSKNQVSKLVFWKYCVSPLFLSYSCMVRTW